MLKIRELASIHISTCCCQLQHGVKHTAGYVLLPLNKVRDPSEGITPVNGLLRRSRYCKFVALASEAGIGPSNLLPSNINCVMLVRVLPILGGKRTGKLVGPKSKKIKRGDVIKCRCNGA